MLAQQYHRLTLDHKHVTRVVGTTFGLAWSRREARETQLQQENCETAAPLHGQQVGVPAGWQREAEPEDRRAIDRRHVVRLVEQAPRWLRPQLGAGKLSGQLASRPAPSGGLLEEQ